LQLVIEFREKPNGLEEGRRERQEMGPDKVELKIAGWADLKKRTDEKDK